MESQHLGLVRDSGQPAEHTGSEGGTWDMLQAPES